MPARSTWLLRVPEILEDLGSMSVPFLDRLGIERLFMVRRRRAIQLMSLFGGGFLVGKTFLIDRLELITSLETLARGEEFLFEQKRKERITADLDRSRMEIRGRRRIPIAAEADAQQRTMNDLPAGIHLRPGELRIEFFGTEDLLRHLFELSQAILNDYGKFKKLVEG